MKSNLLDDNPFWIHGVATGRHFADREQEVERLVRGLRQPGHKVLVYGERRMGKTSALRAAMAQHAGAGGICALADFSTASSPVDLANRVLDAATRALGRRWRDITQEVAKRIGLGLRLGVDPGTQLPTVSVELGLRDDPVQAQRDTLARVLDGLNQLAMDRDVVLGLVLDEFQEIHRFGGQDAEWHLRGVIQHHEQISYVVAGSRTHLIQRMISKGRAFYKLFDLMQFGPIDALRLATWVDERMAERGVAAREVGATALRLAGPRTRDVVQLARKTFELARAQGLARVETVERAFVEVIQDEDDPIRAWWSLLTARQQNVLRAVVASSHGLTVADTVKRFALRSSAAASQTAAKFVQEGVLERVSPGRYRPDNPFLRGWLVLNTLPDLGMHLPATHIA